jgi:hypothetical protein
LSPSTLRRRVDALPRGAAAAAKRGVTIAAAMLLLSSLATPPAAVGFSSITSKPGFDTCAAPTKSAMNTWWSSSPYFNIGIYFGGANRSCAQPNLTSSWIAYVQSGPRNWGLIPIYVGRQMPNPYCQQDATYSSYISTNATTAYNQGWDEAPSAYSAAGSLGFDLPNMPIVYDLESYGNGTGSLTTCRNVAKAFINGVGRLFAHRHRPAGGRLRVPVRFISAGLLVRR